MIIKNKIFLLALFALALQGNNASAVTELTPEQQRLSNAGYAKVTIASSCFWSLLQGIPIALESTNNTQKLGVATRCALLGFVIGNVWLSGKRDLEKAYEHAPESTDPQALTAIGTAFGGFLSFATHIAITWHR